MKISVVGLGLIGGSIALDLKRQLNIEVYGVDSNEQHQHLALERGLVHKIVSLAQACSTSDLIIVAVPVSTIEDLLPTILDQINDQVTVTDVGSTKQNMITSIKDHPRRAQFVASHPLAGTEFSGPTAAFEGLFRNKKNIICDKQDSSDKAVSLVSRVFESIGMHNDYMTADEHDRHMAYVSHLSHISSFTLSLTVLDIEKDENQIFNLASTGFASTVRLAKSNPATWAPIFSRNRTYLSKALSQYIDRLSEFKTALDDDNQEHSRKLMQEANDIKRILDQKK